MTTKEWKVGERVIMKDEFLSCYPNYTKDKVYVVHTVEGGDPELINDTDDDVFFAITAWEVFERLDVELESELDAIERDMADIFARMRAAIDRMA